MMHGLPCSGKSYLAEKIAALVPNAVVLKSINFRKVHGTGYRCFDENNAQTKEDKDESYKLLCEATKTAVENRKIPILDATFHKRYRREYVYGLAKEADAKIIVIKSECDEQSMLERLKNRASQNDKDAFLKSKRSFEIMKEQFDEIDEIKEDVFVKKVNENQVGELMQWLKVILS